MNGSAWGGSEELWYRTALHAAREGRRVGCAVFAWPEKRERLEALRRAGCEVFELPNGGRARRSLGDKVALELVTPVRRLLAVGRLPFQQYEQVVLNQGGLASVCGGLWWGLRAQLRRYALTFHSYHEDLALPPERAARLRAWLAGSSANLFAAERIRDVLEERLGMAVPHASVLVNPITFAPPAAPAPLPAASPFRMVVVAALQLHQKAQDNLVRALAGPAWRGRDWVLDFYGAGPGEAALRALVAAHGLEGRVRLRGFTRDPEAAYRGAHLVLQVTHQDAMPISVLEAMAVGRPLLVSAVGDMPRWVDEGETGWICRDASPESIAAGLERAFAARARWGEMGARAFRAFRARNPASAEQAFLRQVGEAG